MCKCFVQCCVHVIVKADVCVDAWYVVGDTVVFESFVFVPGGVEKHSVVRLH